MQISGGSPHRYYRCVSNRKRGVCPNRLSVRETLTRQRILEASSQHPRSGLAKPRRPALDKMPRARPLTPRMSPLRHSLTSGRKARKALALAIALGLSAMIGCGSDGNGGATPTNTGQACTAVDQCYPGVKAGDLEGDAVCLDKITGGYCTHLCAQDTDCCAAPGECPDSHAEVCGPFESTGMLYCFLSCEDADLAQTTLTDGDVYCHTYAGAAFGCRSTGGGAKNRKVCTP